jgi:hypothetical protein
MNIKKIKDCSQQKIILCNFLGIELVFISKEFEPITILAVGESFCFKICIYVINDKQKQVTYQTISGKPSEEILSKLKIFMECYKHLAVLRWEEVFLFKQKIEPDIITLPLRHPITGKLIDVS